MRKRTFILASSNCGDEEENEGTFYAWEFTAPIKKIIPHD